MDIDNLIEINLRKIDESNDFSTLRTTFVNEEGVVLSDSESERVAKNMYIKGLINLHPAGYKCDLTQFGHKVHDSGGWLKYLLNCAEVKARAEQKEQSEIKIAKLAETNLALQNKHLRTKMLFSVIGFILGVIVTNWKEILTILKIISPPETK